MGDSGLGAIAVDGARSLHLGSPNTGSLDRQYVRSMILIILYPKNPSEWKLMMILKKMPISKFYDLVDL
jgi:hypothetical protein